MSEIPTQNHAVGMGCYYGSMDRTNRVIFEYHAISLVMTLAVIYTHAFIQ